MVAEQRVDEHMKVLTRFARAYCRKQHGRKGEGLCDECRELVQYARGRLEKCPYEPKPMCKDCETHCYAPPYREGMRRMMRFSVKHFARRGRLDVLLRALKAR